MHERHDQGAIRVRECRGHYGVAIYPWRHVGHRALVYLPTSFTRVVRCSLSRIQRLFQISAASLFFWSVTQIPLATAAALGLTGTLMIGPLAWLLMREPLKRDVIGGTLLGFAGALFIVSTETQMLSGDIDGPVLGYLAPILASLCHAVSVVLLRLRSQSEDPIVVAFFANTLPALYVLPVFFLMDAQPTIELFGGYILSAFFGVSFWSLTTIAYARAPAAKLAPMTYTQLIWAAIIGFFLFEELPGASMWLGAAVIVSACFYVMRSSNEES